jgi:hypothetical protein
MLPHFPASAAQAMSGPSDDVFSQVMSKDVVKGNDRMTRNTRVSSRLFPFCD